METKVVAFNVYGTMLAANDPHKELPPRKGLIELLQRFKQDGLIICTCSDNDVQASRNHLEVAGVGLDYFDEFFQMDFGFPKNYKPTLEHYKIKPGQLTAIGDSINRDLIPAINLGCKTIPVPRYDYLSRNSDISSLTLR